MSSYQLVNSNQTQVSFYCQHLLLDLHILWAVTESAAGCIGFCSVDSLQTLADIKAPFISQQSGHQTENTSRAAEPTQVLQLMEQLIREQNQSFVSSVINHEMKNWHEWVHQLPERFTHSFSPFIHDCTWDTNTVLTLSGGVKAVFKDWKV